MEEAVAVEVQAAEDAAEAVEDSVAHLVVMAAL